MTTEFDQESLHDKPDFIFQFAIIFVKISIVTD